MMKSILISLIFYSLIQAQTPFLLMDNVDNNKYAINIAGTEEYAVTANSESLNGREFTLMVWAKTPATIPAGDNILILSTDANSPRGWQLGVSNKIIFFTTTGTTAGGINTSSAQTMATETWYCFAVVCTSATQAFTDFLIYYDGSSKALTDNSSTAVSDVTNPMFIGQQGYPGFERYWLGQIGEVQIILDHGLTAAEILDAFANGFKSSYASGTVSSWYKFGGSNDATMLNDYGAGARDLTGNNITKADDQVKVGTTYK